MIGLLPEKRISLEAVIIMRGRILLKRPVRKDHAA